MKDSDASVGDRIVLKREDGMYDVLGLDANRKRDVRRVGIKELSDAYDIARSGLEDSGGKNVWYTDHRQPDAIDHYKITTP
jgi:hypothetical protein